MNRPLREDQKWEHLQKNREGLHLGTQRIRFRSILAPTDLSAANAISMRLAARLAKQFQSRLCVLYAVMSEVYPGGKKRAVPAIEGLELENAQRALHEYVRHIPELRTAKHEEMTLLGTPANAIQTAVETKGADLLVIGSHGRRGLAKLALGSVAEWAIRHLHCPVLVAGPKCSTMTLQPVESIIFASDLSAETLRPAQYAASIAQEGNGKYTLLHVHTDQSELTEAEKRLLLASLRQLLPYGAQEWCIPRFEVEAGDVGEVILRSAQANRATMIVLGARQRLPLADHAPWGTVSAIISSAHCPILVVPAHWA